MSTVVVKSEYVKNETHESALDQSIPYTFVTPIESQYIPTHGFVNVLQEPVSFTEGGFCPSLHDSSFLEVSPLVEGDQIPVFVDGPFLGNIPNEIDDHNCYLELCPGSLFTPNDQKGGHLSVEKEPPLTKSGAQKTPTKSELRSQRRRQSNRESARRSRSRKKKKIEKLHGLHENLKAEQRQWTLDREAMELQHKRLQLDLLQERNANELLRAQVCLLEQEIYSLDHTLKVGAALLERRQQLEHI